MVARLYVFALCSVTIGDRSTGLCLPDRVFALDDRQGPNGTGPQRTLPSGLNYGGLAGPLPLGDQGHQQGTVKPPR